MLNDPRNPEAYAIVEAARHGDINACTSVSVLCEVYGALTWSQAVLPQSPSTAAAAVALLIESPSAIEVIGDGKDVALRSLLLADKHQLKARRIHDARHAATALQHGITLVYTYDTNDWKDFLPDGLVITWPPSSLTILSRQKT